MSTLIYNGIALFRCQLVGEWQREMAWQGPDRLWVSHKFRVRGLYNPEVNAYAFAGGVPHAAMPNAVISAIEVAAAGDFRADQQTRLAQIMARGLPAGAVSSGPGMARGTVAPLTDLALRDRLSQPRKHLVYAIGSTPVLVAPSMAPGSTDTRALTDACNGPIPLVNDVVYVSGTKSFLVDVGFEVKTIDTGFFSATPSALLSHRFTRQEQLDQDFYATLVTRGRAQFRTDRLIFLGAVPDDFRVHLFQPVPESFKRVSCNVTPTEDGSAVEYEIVDRQLALSIVPRGVTRIEAFHEVSCHGVRVEEFAADTFKSLAGLGLGLRKAGVFDKGTNVSAGLKAQAAGRGLLLKFLAEYAGNLADAIPRLHVTVVARVWGRSDARRKNLETCAVNILAVRMAASINRFALASGGVELTLRHDVSGSFVEGVADIKTAMTSTTLQLLNVNLGDLLTGGVSNIPNVSVHFPQSDDTPGSLSSEHYKYKMDLPNRRSSVAAGEVGTRGTFVGRLVHAALNGQDEVPPFPPKPGRAKQRYPP